MAKNKSVVITGHTSPISYKIEDRDIPVPSPGTVVVKVLAAPLLDYFKVSVMLNTHRSLLTDPHRTLSTAASLTRIQYHTHQAALQWPAYTLSGPMP